jgi:hypothetical protein
MHALTVLVVRFVDGGFPGWVECELTDAEGHRHSFVDKVPMLMNGEYDAESEYPTPDALRCEVLERYQDENGRELVRVSTARPDAIESTGGATEFTVPAILITALDD